MPTKKMKMPEVEVLENTDVQIEVEKKEIEQIDPVPVNEIAEAIELSVILVPLGTNHRQIRIAFDVRTNKVQPSDIPNIVETILTKAAPMIGEKLVEAISVENSLLNATQQK